MFDLSSFMTCKPFLMAKDGKIIRSSCEELIRIRNVEKRGLRVLDVGSGEGSLIEGLCERFVESSSVAFREDVALTVDCVEPHPVGQAYLRRIARQLNNGSIRVNHHDDTIESFLAARHIHYDAILCCHSLYHFERTKWRPLLEMLLDVLRPGGVLILNLVARSSEIYRILERLSATDLERLPRTFEAHGWLYFAEELEPVVKSLYVQARCTEVVARIDFPKEVVADLSHFLRTGRAEEAILVRFLAFMFRIRAEDLASIGGRVLRELAAVSRGLSFRSVDHLWILERRES